MNKGFGRTGAGNVKTKIVLTIKISAKNTMLPSIEDISKVYMIRKSVAPNPSVERIITGFSRAFRIYFVKRMIAVPRIKY